MSQITVNEVPQKRYGRSFAAYRTIDGYPEKVGYLLVHADNAGETVNEFHVSGEVFSLAVPGEDSDVAEALLDAAAQALGTGLTRADDASYSPFEMSALRGLPRAEPVRRF